MKIHLMIFAKIVPMTKTYESVIRPVVGDMIHDPGFHAKFHNGYEVAKVTLDYSADECWVSLAPSVIELEEIPVEGYLAHLESHGWRAVSQEDGGISG
ncbi:hypothetical protein [Paenibacillus soyae]|uniref:Uncharacterized protein n=1 Tax=Paenibacillus soyae TaxID=2969249 RepID=A0A9X2MX96_9BACL|nr:hypothetical protein [Paenibacillus soyae]MCR2808034.1 hypothetical protein [Paenibacillus soyae]